MTSHCEREAEVLELVMSGADPTSDLATHARNCPICRDLAEVVEAVREDYAATLAEARLPPPMMLWWRAELQVRQDAVRAAARPITLTHAFAAAAATGLLLALGKFLPGAADLVLQAQTLTGTLSMYADRALSVTGGPLLAALGCCLMLAPLAAWLILSED